MALIELLLQSVSMVDRFVEFFFDLFEFIRKLLNEPILLIDGIFLFLKFVEH